MKIAGTPVKDADEKIVVHITRSDVRFGAKKNANSCAAARALCRQTGAEAAKVHFSRAYIKTGDKWLRFSVPPALRSEVMAFDRGGEFAPGDYVLSPLQPTVRLDAPKKHNKKPIKKVPQRGNKPKKPYHVVAGVRERMNAD